ncbi:hypothetical protein [Brevibacterium salitolerans]|uniref:Uncharacterized protein n=1 Tax=Brevibacterium salitolerans TaxID=1403566 RepID=A0ABN2WM63_9MICO
MVARTIAAPEAASPDMREAALPEPTWPVPAPLEPTSGAVDSPGPEVARAHEHGWQVESRHATSQGWVLYVRCGECGVRRVDLAQRSAAVPEALSTEVGVPEVRHCRA